MAAVGCDVATSSKDSGGESVDLNFTGSALESLPLVKAASSQMEGLFPPPAPNGETAADYMELAKFFRYECHMHPQANFCPPDVDVAQNDGMNEWKFSATTLMGLIYHAQMYSGGLRGACSHTEASIDGDSFTAAAERGDPDRFILDQYSLYTCKGEDTYEGNSAYIAYSVAPDYQATLTTRYRHPFGNSDFDQTDIFQVYVALRDEVPTHLGFNWAGISSMFGRAIVLVDFENHRFAAEYLSGGQQTKHVIAVGSGGIDRATGVPYPGHYWARFFDEMSKELLDKCVDNETQAIEADEAPCTAEGIPIGWGASEELATFLGLDDTQAARLAPFLAKLATADPLPETEVGQAEGDADLYFPQSMR
jgi:hypothetical protein